MEEAKLPSSPSSSPVHENFGVRCFHPNFLNIAIAGSQNHITLSSKEAYEQTSSDVGQANEVPESSQNIWKQYRKNRDSSLTVKASENDGKQLTCDPDQKEFPENHKSAPMSEENAEFIKSFNETLKAPYRLSYVPSIPKFGLLFWTQDDFYYLKNLIKLNPNIFYQIPVLPAAENLSDPYYYHKELKKLAVKAAFRAGTATSVEDPLPYPKYNTNVYPRDVDAVWMDTGVIGEHCFPQSQCYAPSLYPTPATSKLEAYKLYGRQYSQSTEDSMLGFQTIVAPHLMHQYSHCNFEYTSIAEEDKYLNISMNVTPEETTSSPPQQMDAMCCNAEDFHKDVTRQNESTNVCDGEQNNCDSSEQTQSAQVKPKKELHELCQHSNMAASYSAVAGAGLHKDYKKYLYSDSDNTMYSGLMAGFNKLLGKRGSSLKATTDFELGEESISSLSEEFSPIVISDEAMKSGVLTGDIAAFNKRLQETLGSSSFSKDDCADSRTSQAKIRRKSSHSRSRSLSPSPEDAIRKFVLLSPFTENVECVFCKGNSQTEEVYRSHPIRDKAGIVICPYLRKYVCLLCNATGDNAHTIKYCPFNKRGFYAKRENFPPFNSSGQKENASDSSNKSFSVSLISSTPISNENTTSKTRQLVQAPTNDKAVKGRKLDFSIVETVSKCDCSFSCTSGANLESKESSCLNSFTTDQSMDASETLSVTDNSTFFRQLDKIKKSAKKLWKAGRST